MRPRLLAAAVLGLLAVLQIVRGAVVRDGEALNLASSLWPDHPEILKEVGMRGVGEAAAAGNSPTAATMEQIRRLAVAAPFAPEPFLVEAALAMKQGESSRAERLLKQALRRDPRSKAGLYLLAEHYVRNGQLAQGLVEMARLTLVVPSSSVEFAKLLEQFVQSGGTADHLKQLFGVNPFLEEFVLNRLAKDPANARLIVTAATRRAAGEGDVPQWQGTLLNSMVEAGQYREAYDLWLRLTGAPRAEGVFNPSYRRTREPPPFNWSFTSDEAGVAEGQDEMLRVFHYGTKNAVLAKQVLLLEPGAYELAVNTSGEVPGPDQLAWTLKCLPSGEERIAAALPNQGGLLRARFEIPGASCGAQLLELQGRGQDPAKTAHVRMGPIQMKRIAR